MQIPNADVGQGLPALLDTRSFTTAPVFAAFLRVDPNHLCDIICIQMGHTYILHKKIFGASQKCCMQNCTKTLMSLLYCLLGKQNHHVGVS